MSSSEPNEIDDRTETKATVADTPEPAARTIPLDRDWLFGGHAEAGSSQPGFDDSDFERVTLPHTNAVFSWHDIDRSRYEYVSIYRRYFSLPSALQNQRVFIDFGAVMTAATVTINGERLGEYEGGYTPFSFELTPHLNWDGDNVIAVEVDSRRSRNVPPFGGIVDYDTFGGIYRCVSLRVVPETFIENVFAKPADVLSDERRLEVRCFMDSVAETASPVSVVAELHDSDRLVAADETTASSESSTVELTLNELGQIELWDIDNPKRYDVRVRLQNGQTIVQEYTTRVGFREARFTPDGFFLNGSRRQLFGLNRHQLFPYVGNAMPPRVQRRDAEILKQELNCNIVRTSHYVQSPAFLDACDELGLLVWEELPGWQYVGDDTWKEIARENTETMIRRDWNHPSVVLWGVRINESHTDALAFYDELDRLAHELDDSRQTTGAYHKDHPLRQDVYGLNIYGDLQPGQLPEPSGERAMVSEAVGQYNFEDGFDRFYRRTDPGHIQQRQAERHAKAHNQVADDDRYAGLTAWCAFEYNSPVNPYRDVKTPGVCDIFRIPKPGASFYRSQCDPGEEVIIEPAFYWDFDEKAPEGPGENAMICSNCDQLEIYIDGERAVTTKPDHGECYENLSHPPFFVDLGVKNGAAQLPELRIDGVLDGETMQSRSFSADRSTDQLLVTADDDELVGNGIDATRVVLRAVDTYGNPRPFVTGEVTLRIDGPGEIVGDNPFSFTESGGAGAVWIKTTENGAGDIRLRAHHADLGSMEITVRATKS